MTIVFVLYLYIFISKNQSKVPEVRFWGQSIPISGSSVRPRVITPHFRKCVNADLVLLQLQGIRIMNYIDDWLILAQSHQLAVRHRYVVLAHIKELGLRLNAKECAFSTTEDHFPWHGMGLNVDAGAAVSGTYRVHPVSSSVVFWGWGAASLLSSFQNADQEKHNLLCPVQALDAYVHRAALWR